MSTNPWLEIFKVSNLSFLVPLLFSCQGTIFPHFRAAAIISLYNSYLGLIAKIEYGFLLQ